MTTDLQRHADPLRDAKEVNADEENVAASPVASRKIKTAKPSSRNCEDDGSDELGAHKGQCDVDVLVER